MLSAARNIFSSLCKGNLDTATENKFWVLLGSPLLFKLLIGIESCGALRLLAEPHAVTHGFVIFQMDRCIIYL